MTSLSFLKHSSDIAAVFVHEKIRGHFFSISENGLRCVCICISTYILTFFLFESKLVFEVNSIEMQEWYEKLHLIIAGILIKILLKSIFDMQLNLIKLNHREMSNK